MKTDNLYKVEIYRFFHTFLIFICMAAGLSAILFLAMDNSDTLLGDGTAAGALDSAMRVADLIIVLIASVGISNYAGREFRLKTINYEIMSGYPLWKISITKTVTCGIFVSVMLQLCILVFLMTVPGALQMFFLIHILFMFFILFHICSCTVLYVILCRNGALGGSLAFVRFTLLEVVGLFFAELFVPDRIYGKCRALSVMSQWSAVIRADSMIPQEYMLSIVVSAVAEYVLLLAVIQLCSKKIDF